MKIAIVTTTSFHLIRIAKEFIDKGHEVLFYSYLPSRFAEARGVPLRNQRSLFSMLMPKLALLKLPFPDAKKHKVREQLRGDVDRLAARLLEPCDIFIGLSSVAIESAKVAKQMFGAKIICERGSAHVLFQKTALHGTSEALTDAYIQRELESYEVADYVAIPSQFSLNTFLQYETPARKMFVNMYGVDLGNFKSTMCPSYDNRFGFAGGWMIRKGTDLMCNAIEQFHGHKIIHAGNAMSRTPCDPFYESLGFLPERELQNFYGKINVFLFPSLEDGFGMVLSQAVACGVPIVASENTGAPDIRALISNKKYITIVKPDDLDDLIRGMNEGLEVAKTQSGSRDYLGDERRLLTWDAYGERYLEFLNEI